MEERTEILVDVYMSGEHRVLRVVLYDPSTGSVQEQIARLLKLPPGRYIFAVPDHLFDYPVIEVYTVDSRVPACLGHFDYLSIADSIKNTEKREN